MRKCGECLYLREHLALGYDMCECPLPVWVTEMDPLSHYHGDDVRGLVSKDTDASGCKIFRRNPRPTDEPCGTEMLEKARDAVDNFTKNGQLCPRDTDGDGDCGQPFCPVCGTGRQTTEGE